MSDKASPKPPKDLGKGPELNLVAQFDPFWHDEAARWQAIELGFWHAATNDFVRIVAQGTKSKKQPLIIDSPNGLPYNIDKTYGRINLFTHGNPKVIGFGGRIVEGNVTFASYLAEEGFERSISADLCKKKRKLMSSHTLLMVYACNAGACEPLLQRIADAMGVWVGGFTQAVHMHPWRPGIGARVVDRGSINAKETIYLGLGDKPGEDTRIQPKDETTDFHNLGSPILVQPKI